MAAALDRRTVWQSYSRWTSGVCVVTARSPEGIAVGVTATSFSPVSVSPPIVSWCLDNRSGSVAAFRDAATFAVHILGESQDETSTCFATAGIDKFAYRPLDADADVPLLRNCLARFVCDNLQQIPAGDHTLFLGAVRDVELSDGDPLVYFTQRYGRYAVHPSHDPTRPRDWL